MKGAFFRHCLIALPVLFLSTISYGQGCSDAGFCTMGAMKPDQPFNKKIQVRFRTMELSFYRGKTTLSPVVHVLTADMGFSLNRTTSFQVKLPYQQVSGNLGENSSLSDISLCLTRNVFSSEDYDINVSVGTKIPTNDSNKKWSGPKNGPGDKPMPMYYQTSLGTYDVIGGISYISKRWLVATGIQVPLNENNNEFVHSEWPNYPDKKYLLDNDSAYHLKRGTDIMLRIERNFRFSRFNFSAGLLPIYRITKDEITIDRELGTRQKMDGTTGLALSAIITAGYNFNIQSSVRVLVGRKITQRDFNPDGLTRHAVMTISYLYRF